jgi:two-component system, NarL family, sensor histidine kinase DesK
MRLIPKDFSGGWTAYVWLVYLGAILVGPVFGHATPREWFWTITSLVIFLALYFRAYWVSDRGLLWCVAGIAAVGAGYATINPAASAYFIYAAAFLGRLANVKLAIRAIAFLLVVVIAESWALSLSPQFWVIALVFMAMVGGVNIHYSQVGRSNARLRLAEEEIAHLAKSNERERIARDLHDVLGHTLSLIILKSELAARLADRDPVRAAEEIREVESISRAALSQVRAAITGYRAGSLASEIAQVAAALETAGVSVDTSIAPVRLEATQEGVLALAVREAATNIIRHAGASHCTMILEVGDQECRLEVHDDGRGGSAHEGAGLAGMRERVEGLGGHLDRDGAQGTRLVIRIPLTTTVDQPMPPPLRALA